MLFYKGDIAKTIDAFMKKNGGYLSYKDLADDTATWVEPVSTTYRGYRVWELPPNGQGISCFANAEYSWKDLISVKFNMEVLNIFICLLKQKSWRMKTAQNIMPILILQKFPLIN